MTDRLPSLDELFDFNRARRAEQAEAEPEAEPAPTRRRLRGDLVRTLNATKAAAQPDRVALARSSAEVQQQAAAIKEKFRAARQQLGAPEAELPEVLPPIAVAVRPRVRAARIDVTPETRPESPERTWVLTVIAGSEDRSFYLAASDAFEAASHGARQIAGWMREHRPGVGWRVSSLELLHDVL